MMHEADAMTLTARTLLTGDTLYAMRGMDSNPVD